MRRYDDPVEVRRGPITGQMAAQITGQITGQTLTEQDEGPEQFLWRGRLWKVRAVLAHWVETGAWWQSSAAREAIGTEGADGGPGPAVAGRAGDLLAERELWRVEAAAGMTGAQAQTETTETDGQAVASSTCPSTGPTAPGSSSAASTSGAETRR